MPIRPENKARYPKDWPALSMAARERAKWRCEHQGCTATQYSVGHWIRWAGGPFEWRPVEGNLPATTAQDREFFMAGEGRDAAGELWTYGKARAFVERWCWGAEDDDRPTVIVLTVAHLNHQPEDCRPENLSAMCQRHHLAYDAEHHKRTAYATRKASAQTADLF